MFDTATIAAVRPVAARLNVPLAHLLAIAEVESAGKAYAVVDGRNEPLIRFEGHYFHARLTGAARAAAVKAGLASPKAGAVPNPSSQAARWKLLARAVEINAGAAYESVSWGVGQVMGAHWKGLGFGSVTELVNLARRNVAGQVEIMARFIERDAALLTALRKADWPAFARGYNGANYAKNAYDTKMAKAAAAWTKKLAAEPAPPPPKPVIVTAAPEPPPTKPPPALQPATKPAEAVKDESAGFFAALAAFLARIFRR